MREWRLRNIDRMREYERAASRAKRARNPGARKAAEYRKRVAETDAALREAGVSWAEALIAYALDLRARFNARASRQGKRSRERAKTDADHAALVRARRDRQLAKHGDAIRARDRARYAANAEAVKQRGLARRAADPAGYRERKLELKHARRAKMVGRYTAEDIAAIVNEQDGCCYYCGRALSRDRKERHVDHMTPVSRGGTNWPDNIAVACADCNLRKGALTADEFLLRRRAAA
jgi:5-methylcytosine-specific restriction endonuclease McrA